jgi:hypothetical protein
MIYFSIFGLCFNKNFDTHKIIILLGHERQLGNWKKRVDFLTFYCFWKSIKIKKWCMMKNILNRNMKLWSKISASIKYIFLLFSLLSSWRMTKFRFWYFFLWVLSINYLSNNNHSDFILISLCLQDMLKIHVINIHFLTLFVKITDIYVYFLDLINNLFI